MRAEAAGQLGLPDTAGLVHSAPKKENDGSTQDCCEPRKSIACERKPCNSPQFSGKDCCIAQTCCDTLQDDEQGIQPSVTGPSPKSSLDDVEKGKPDLEHVLLSVEGMTCVGCETKLYRFLNSFPSAINIQTSLLLSRAEFDLDLSIHSVHDITSSIKKCTGFACERIRNGGQDIDVVVAGGGKDLVDRNPPLGVTDMVFLGTRVVRITYNPSIVGARELIENGFGTSISLAPPRPDPALAVGRNDVRRKLYMTLFSAVLTIPVLILAWAPLPENDTVYGATSLALATIVQFVVAGPFYPIALRGLLFTHVIEMDLLIVLSTTTAYVFSVVSFAYQTVGQPLSTGQFFETSTLLVTLIMLGRLVSAFARHKAVESISITSLQASTALLVDDDGNNARQIDARLLQYDDLFKVMPDSRIPTDGVVMTGKTEVDESMVTGEAQLVEKSLGSTVIAGSMNGPGAITVRLTRLPSENTISEIAGMVDEAKYSKPKVQELADLVAGYFVPVVVILTIITFITWVAVGKMIRHQNAASAVVHAITYAISVIIISCPCAIGLAVPMVIVIAGGVAAKNGVVFKSAETIEIARKVTHVVLDKTGTLTMGQLSVCTEEYLAPSKDSTRSLTLGLTSNTQHPVSNAIVAHLHSLGVQPTPVKDVQSIAGSGVEGTYNETTIRAGNCRWLSVESSPHVQSALSKGLTVLCITSGSTLLAVYGLSDTIRPDAHSVITSLKSRNIDISIVSGDDHGAVHAVAAQLDIPASNVRSKCTPADKEAYIRTLLHSPVPTINKTKRKSTKPVILFLGDGTNDAPALATATIGLHMPSSSSLPAALSLSSSSLNPTLTPTPTSTSSPSPLAQSASSASLLTPSLHPLLTLIDLSTAVHRRIVFNFVWAFGYNVFAILLAAGAFEGVRRGGGGGGKEGGVGVRVEPKWAAVGEIVSVLPVVGVAVGLRFWRGGAMRR
ncbi:hypothetical protein MMC16_004995 [Acarospora aff. strigata]|nr:hypothetical protein [Acarospora aff. strigata]